MSSTSASLPKHLKIGIVLFPNALPLDWIGPQDIFNTLTPTSPRSKELDLSFALSLLGDKVGPLLQWGGLEVVVEKSFNDALKEEWDAILVPGGQGARPWDERNAAAQEFIKAIEPKVKLLFTVCTGSWLVAHTGVLRGHRATTNKAAYAQAKEHTADKGVEWVPKARWVQSGKVWTSSGVSAGLDMTAAFLRHFLSIHLSEAEAKKQGDRLLGILEVFEHDEDDDPFAERYGLT